MSSHMLPTINTAVSHGPTTPPATPPAISPVTSPIDGPSSLPDVPANISPRRKRRKKASTTYDKTDSEVWDLEDTVIIGQ